MSITEKKKVVATVTVGPKSFWGSKHKWIQIDIVKPRSAISESVSSLNITPSPDNRWIVKFAYTSGNSMGVNNRGTISCRTYTRHRTEVVDELNYISYDGKILYRYDENGCHENQE